jgi:hypothetical protein
MNGSDAVWVSPDGKQISAQVGTGGGADLWFKVLAAADAELVGKTIKALYQKAKGPVTDFITLALGKPDGDAPSQFDTAMKGGDGSTEFVFAKCESNKCDFSSVFKGIADPTTSTTSTTSTTTTKAVTTTTTQSSKMCSAEASDCKAAAEQHTTSLTFDTDCVNGGLGCDAYGLDCCKYCGFDHFTACPAASIGLTYGAAPAALSVGTDGPSESDASFGAIIGVVACAAFLVAAAFGFMSMRQRSPVGAPGSQMGASLLENEMPSQVQAPAGI